MEEITRKQLWECGLHLDWRQRGTWMQFGNDVDMSAEIAELEQAAARLLGGKWKISLATDDA